MTKGKPLKIGLFMIGKDKADVILQALDSTQAVFDGYFYQDTGSTDNTPELFEQWCERNHKPCVVSRKKLIEDYKVVYPFPDKPVLAEFGKARNDCFALNDGMDFAFWIDTDDTLVNPQEIYGEAERMRKEGIPALLAIYDYAERQGGIAPMTQKRERLLDLSVKGEWISNVHETYRIEDYNQMPPTTSKFSVTHKRTPKQVHDTGRRNLLIMQLEMGEGAYTKEVLDKLSDKVLQNLAYDHWEYKEYEKAIICYESILARGNTGNANEFFVHTYLCEAFLAMGNIEEAILHAFTCMRIAPHLSTPYLYLAKIYAQINNFDEASHYAERVIELGVPQIVAPINEFDYIVTPRKLLVEADVRKGNVEGALERIMELRNVAPSQNLTHEITNLNLNIKDQKALKGYSAILDYIRAYNLTDALDGFVKSIPKELRNNEYIRKLIKEAKRDYKRKHTKQVLGNPKTIVLYAGGSYEHWDGHSDSKNGIGGSEGMTIQLMRALAKLGNKVVIYGNPEKPGMYDGVEYRDHTEWNANIKCDIGIILRNPAMFRSVMRAKKQYSWLHDTHYGDLPADLFYFPNKVTALSEAHKQVLMESHGIRDESIFWMTRNALNSKSLKYAKREAEERKPFQMIYASSYDRGLINVLNMWPKIKEEIPEATLKIFYGWNTYDVMMNQRLQQNDPYGRHMVQLKQEIVDKIASLDGVTEYGRISQDELYKEFAESDVWFYSTEFYEISCQPAGELVFTNKGMKPIEEITTSDKVLTHKGRFMPVTNIIEKNHKGKLHGLKRKKNNTRMWFTPEHEIYTSRANGRSDAKSGRVYSRTEKSREWIPTEDLTPKLDWMLTPKGVYGELNTVELTDSVDNLVENDGLVSRKNHPMYKKVPNNVVLDKLSCWFLGYFCAEGCVSNAESRAGWYSAITFSSHVREDESRDKVVEFMDRFGINVKEKQVTENGMVQNMYCSPLAHFLKNTIGTSRDKRVPEFIWQTTTENQKAFVEGMMDGDGHYYKRTRTLGYTTISPHLAYGLRQLLANQGVLPSVHYYEPRDSYQLNWQEKQDGSHAGHIDFDDVVGTRLSDVEIIDYEGAVYDIEVAEDHSYVTQNTIVHNCITAMQAQALGAIPVCTPVGALRETVNEDFGFKLNLDNIQDGLIYLLKNHEELDARREPMMKWAKKAFDVKSLAKEWDEEFNS